MAWKSLIHCWAMVETNVDPAPVIVPGAQAILAVVVPVEPFVLLSLPHAANRPSKGRDQPLYAAR